MIVNSIEINLFTPYLSTQKCLIYCILIKSEMHECPPFNGYAADEVFDTYPKDDVQKYPYRVTKERRNANFQKKGKSFVNL